MSKNKAISEHYTHGKLINDIEAALHNLGLTKDNITCDDLAPVDEFHIGGRAATEHFFSLVNFKEQDHILDVGCGIGGASRFVANKYNCHITGIDLTEEFIKTGQIICTWLDMGNSISLHQGSALSMPFDDHICDNGFMMHVGMNIEDKISLFKEVYRVLKPGASFGIYDIMQLKDQKITYPVPWATTSDTSFLSTPDQYKQALKEAGFSILEEKNRLEIALSFFKEARKKGINTDDPSNLGLHIILGDNAALKIKNMVLNVSGGLIAPVELIAQK